MDITIEEYLSTFEFPLSENSSNFPNSKGADVQAPLSVPDLEQDDSSSTHQRSCAQPRGVGARQQLAKNEREKGLLQAVKLLCKNCHERHILKRASKAKLQWFRAFNIMSDVETRSAEFQAEIQKIVASIEPLITQGPDLVETSVRMVLESL